MRTIAKGAEPASLTTHRQTPHANYDNYVDKDGLRHALIIEQRGICCYCMNRIHNAQDTMKIEHWRSQSSHPEEQLAYRNMLGACLGGQGRPHNLQHCDTRKADSSLQWNPADPVHHVETRVRYEADGSIRSDEGAFNVQLDDVLNLNVAILRNNRRAVLDAVLDWWRREKARIGGAVPRATFETERARRTGGAGDLQPYCQVAVWWLDQRLAQMAA